MRRKLFLRKRFSRGFIRSRKNHFRAAADKPLSINSSILGIWFSLHRCEHVRVLEYVPSSRASRRCHYYAPRDDTACTLGAWHPLAQEKALAEKIRENPDVEVFQRGFIDIPGFISINC